MYITICCKLSPKQWRANKFKVVSYSESCGISYFGFIQFHKLSSKLPCLLVTWLCRESLKSVTDMLPRNACSPPALVVKAAVRAVQRQSASKILASGQLEWRCICTTCLSEDQQQLRVKNNQEWNDPSSSYPRKSAFMNMLLSSSAFLIVC